MMKILILSLCFWVSAATASDLDKDRRWSEQIVEGLLVGEAVELKTGETAFLGLYAEASEGPGDRAVILLHGIPTWSYLYHDVIPLLAPHARLIAPDFLGHGYSDRRDRFDRSLLAQTAMVSPQSAGQACAGEVPRVLALPWLVSQEVAQVLQCAARCISGH